MYLYIKNLNFTHLFRERIKRKYVKKDNKYTNMNLICTKICRYMRRILQGKYLGLLTNFATTDALWRLSAASHQP